MVMLPGDPGRHFGDAREITHRVVARREVGVPKVKHEELAFAAGPLRLGIGAPKEIDVALGVEHDHDFATANVLRNE